MDTDPWFPVAFVAPSGYQYEVTATASSEVEAVRLADDTVDYVSRTCIRDHLEEDGLTVRPPARLKVERVPSDQGTPAGPGYVITAPDGTVTRT